MKHILLAATLALAISPALTAQSTSTSSGAAPAATPAVPATTPSPSGSSSPEASPTTPVASSPNSAVSSQPAPVAKPGTVVLPPEKANPVTIPQFASPPVIDGKLDDQVWQSAAVLKDFYQITPGDNVSPSKPTEVLIGYDPKFLYIAFRAYDEPDKIRATVAKRDNIFQDDYVGFYPPSTINVRHSKSFSIPWVFRAMAC